MESIFRPTKWFVIFCGALVLVWASLQLVANLRVADEARAYARDIYSWSWPAFNLQSTAEITGATVVRRTDTDATVKVVGRQTLRPITQEGTSELGNKSSQEMDLSAALTFYRSNNNWVLGSVELDK